MPTSKETRVRVDGLEKSSAHVCPASGLEEIRPRFVLNSAVRRNTPSISSREICSMLSRCFICFFFLLLLVSLLFAPARRDQRSLLQSRKVLGALPLRANSKVATSEPPTSPLE